MDYSGASAYIYAKVCALVSKAYAGENALKLFNAKSLSELWDMVFSSPCPQVPEQMLANQIEVNALKRFIEDYSSLLKLYSKPDSFLLELLHRYEVVNIKVMSAALRLGETELPNVIDLGEYETLNYSAWPNLKKITEKSVFSWYDHVPTDEERLSMDYRLDSQEVNIIWKALNKIPDSSKGALVEYYTEEYRRMNMMWALRLKVYYQMPKDEILKHLFYVSKSVSADDPLCKYAFEVLDKEIDNFEDWRTWRFSSFLNPHNEGQVWSIDPVWIEQKFSVGEVHRIKKVLHQYPLTYASLVMYFRVKLQELNAIRAATEALRLDADKSEAMYVAGISGSLNNGGQ